MRVTFKLLLRVSLIALVTSTLTTWISAQQSNSRAGLDRILRERDRQFNKRTLEKELRKPADQTEQRLAFAQIKEDYVRIQVINHELAKAFSGGGTPDLTFIAKSAAEIKKRAERLKHNLVLPKPEKGFKRPDAHLFAGTEQLKSPVSTMSGLIVEFVNNQLFKATSVVDAKSSAKARLDLEQIIELSDYVRKSSEMMSKETRKSH